MPEEEKNAPEGDADLKTKFKGSVAAKGKQERGVATPNAKSVDQAAVDDYVANFVPKLAQEYVHKWVFINLPDGCGLLVPSDMKGTSRVALNLDEVAVSHLKEQLNKPKAQT